MRLKHYTSIFLFLLISSFSLTPSFAHTSRSFGPTFSLLSPETSNRSGQLEIIVSKNPVGCGESYVVTVILYPPTSTQECTLGDLIVKKNAEIIDNQSFVKVCPYHKEKIFKYSSTAPFKGAAEKWVASWAEYTVSLKVEVKSEWETGEASFKKFKEIYGRGFQAYLWLNTPDSKCLALIKEKLNVSIEIRDPVKLDSTDNQVMVLGGPISNDLAQSLNAEYGIIFSLHNSPEEIKLTIGNRKYEFNKEMWMKKDYGVIYLNKTENSYVLMIEGFTRYGTYAASLYLVNNYRRLGVTDIAIILWEDANHNHEVELNEVKLIEKGLLRAWIGSSTPGIIKP